MTHLDNLTNRMLVCMPPGPSSFVDFAAQLQILGMQFNKPNSMLNKFQEHAKDLIIAVSEHTVVDNKTPKEMATFCHELNGALPGQQKCHYLSTDKDIFLCRGALVLQKETPNAMSGVVVSNTPILGCNFANPEISKSIIGGNSVSILDSMFFDGVSTDQHCTGYSQNAPIVQVYFENTLASIVEPLATPQHRSLKYLSLNTPTLCLDLSKIVRPVLIRKPEGGFVFEVLY